MLNAARQALIEVGVLSPTEPLPPFSARMSGNLILLFYMNNGLFYLVKLGLQTTLDREYRGLTAAHAALPANVPRPLRFATHGAFEVIVTSGLRHDPLIPPRSTKDARLLEDGIDAFLAASTHAFRTPRPGASASKLREAIRQTSKLVTWPGWEDYCHRIHAYSQELTPVLQHGDFAANNIGVTDDTLVFFDWEDFGLIDLPGFDLAVFLLSLNNFNMDKVIGKLAIPSVEARLVQRGCAYWGIRPAEFLDLIPAYLSLYIHTKSSLGYPLSVTNRAAAALAAYLQLAPTLATGS